LGIRATPAAQLSRPTHRHNVTLRTFNPVLHVCLIDGYAAIQGGGGLPVVGGGGSLMTHSAYSVTAQRIAFKYVMASEPYRYT
jgi:hypothetical protein